MYDVVTIGDTKMDVFISLENCKEKCDLKNNKITFQFGEKISIDVSGQQIAGSAPNVATALTRMGQKTAVISNMGDDQTYIQAIKTLDREGVDTKYIKAHKNTKSAYSAVLNLEGEKTILVSYIEKSYKLPKDLKTKWLYMSEMGSGYESLYKQVISHIKKTGTKLGFNPGNQQLMEKKEILFKLLKHTQVLFVNIEEGLRLVGSKKLTIKSLAKRLHALGPKEVVITDGRNGAYGYDGTTMWQSEIYPGPRIESTGAGDAFASAYIGAQLHGETIKEALRWGFVNSAEAVLHIGPTKGLLRDTQIKSRLNKAKDFQPKEI
jgi:ribokinase